MAVARIADSTRRNSWAPTRSSRWSWKGSTGDSKPRDLTRVAEYVELGPRGGLGRPLGPDRGAGRRDGDDHGPIGGTEARMPVTVRDFADGLPVNFANQVVPIFTKLGCNSGGCHGKASGQNGFRLTLLGFEPELDYETLVKEGRGRRALPRRARAEPAADEGDRQVPHGGGKKLEAGLARVPPDRRWIAAGMPVGKATDPTVAADRDLSRRAGHGARHERSSSPSPPTTPTARPRTSPAGPSTSRTTPRSPRSPTGGRSRRASCGPGGDHGPLPGAGRASSGPPSRSACRSPRTADFPAGNLVDAAALQAVEGARDRPVRALHRRRVHPPGVARHHRHAADAAEVKAFVADTDPDEAARSWSTAAGPPEYADFFAIKWADILRNKREGERRSTRRRRSASTTGSARPRQEHAVRPVRAGDPRGQRHARDRPAGPWYRRIKATDAFVDDTAQVFLGMRLQCAKCHHHPSRSGARTTTTASPPSSPGSAASRRSQAQRVGRDDEVIFTARDRRGQPPQDGQDDGPQGPRRRGRSTVAAERRPPPEARRLDGRPEEPVLRPGGGQPLLGPLLRPRDRRADGRHAGDQPAVEPRAARRPGRRLRPERLRPQDLVRTICTSRIYGLSSVPNEYNAKDKQSFARYYPKRLRAEVLLDAISQVTGMPTAFAGLPAGTRAIELPDESVASTFLDTFGRPKRDTRLRVRARERREPRPEPDAPELGEVQGKLVGGRRPGRGAREGPAARRREVDELFWTAFGRARRAARPPAPSPTWPRTPDKTQEAYEDIIWALINAKEFQFND